MHFSPESIIKNEIQKNKNCTYYPCNIIDGAEKYTVDIMNIPFEDKIFDFIICNHILEHLENDNKALSELKRVIKKCGKILITVPISISDKEILETKK